MGAALAGQVPAVNAHVQPEHCRSKPLLGYGTLGEIRELKNQDSRHSKVPNTEFLRLPPLATDRGYESMEGG